MKKCLCAVIVGTLILVCGSKIYSQNVGINSDGSAPNANAMLDVASPATGNGKGMLIPRISQAQRTTASAALAGGLLDGSGNLRGGAAQGLLVYQTDGTQGFYYNTSATSTPIWIFLTSGSSDSANTANAIVKRDASGNFAAGTITANLAGNATSATSVTGTVAIANGGTGATDAFGARTNLELGTISMQNQDSVNIDGGEIDGTTIGATTAAAGKFTDVTAGTTNSYYIGSDKVLHRGNHALLGNIVVGNGGEIFDNTGGGDTGNYNTAMGNGALLGDSTGYYNTAMGCNALYSNGIGTNNTATGNQALAANTNGGDNTACGSWALGANQGGGNNTANGFHSLAVSTSSYNTASGAEALANTLNGENTAIGYHAGNTITTGYQNTFLGCTADADVGYVALFNATAIGYGALVTASNTVRIGNGAVTQIRGHVPYTDDSDRRLKENIQPSTLGLSFVEKLNPVKFNYLNQNMIHDGFIAQDVEQVCNELGVEFGGLVKPQNETEKYGLTYSEFVVPLVNAVKELKAENNELKAELKAIKEKLGME